MSSNVRYTVEVAYLQTGKLKSPFEAANSSASKSMKDYDRAVSRTFREQMRQGKDLERQQARAAREAARNQARSNYASERRGRYAIDGATSIGSSVASGFGSAVDTMGGMLISGLTAAATTAGNLIASGVKTTLKTGIGFADEMERAQISFAAMQKMQVGGSWRQNMVAAGDVMAQARKDAAELPGEFSDVMAAMKTLGTPGMQSGMDLGRVEKLSANLVAMAEIEGMSTKVAATQMARIMQGRMTGNNNFGLRLGITDFKAMNKMDPAKRAALMEKTLKDGAAPALDEFKHSWRGLTSNISDNWKNVAKSFATPLMASLKGAMGQGLDWFGKNEDAVHAFALNLGRYLERGFLAGQEFIQVWYHPVMVFGDHLFKAISGAFEKFSPFLESMGNKLYKFMEDPEGIDKIVDAAKMLGGLKMASMGLNAGTGALTAGAPLLKMLGVGGEGALAGAGAGAAIAAGAVAVAALGVAAYGAFDVLTDSSNQFHNAATASVERTKDMVLGTDKTVSQFDRLWTAIQPLVDLMGVSLVFVIEANIGIASRLTGAFLDAVDAVELFKAKLTGHANFTNGDDKVGAAKYTYSPNPWEYSPQPKNANWDFSEDDGKKMKAKVPPNHTTHIHKVEIAVQSNQDPFRVAKETLKVLNDVARNPKVSRSAPGNGVSF